MRCPMSPEKGKSLCYPNKKCKSNRYEKISTESLNHHWQPEKNRRSVGATSTVNVGFAKLLTE